MIGRSKKQARKSAVRLAMYDRYSVGVKVTDTKGKDLGEIVGGSTRTGKWQVKDANGRVTTYEGPQLVDLPGQGREEY